MIDFRYHLVSLISVFLALAVGIVLGAGPLQGPIGSSLQSQVDGLRSDRDSLRADLDESRSHTEQTAAFVEATAGQLIDGALDDRTVTVIRASGADNDAADAIGARIEAAGGQVASDVSLAESAFSSPDDALVQELRDADPTLPEEDEAVVTAALARALSAEPAAADEAGEDGSTADPTDPADPSDSSTKDADPSSVSEELFRVLADSGRLAGGEWAESDAVVVLAPSLTADESASPTPTATSTEDAEPPVTRSAAVIALSGFSSALSSRTTTVVSGPTTSADGGLLADLRSDRVDLSTVDGTDLATGPVLVPLVLEAALDGTFGDFGTAQGATAVLPDSQR